MEEGKNSKLIGSKKEFLAEMKASVIKCPCGSETFTVIETLVHRASISVETGRLEVFKCVENETEDDIHCSSCNKLFSFSEDFNSDIDYL